MRLKANWKENLRAIRRREIDTVLRFFGAHTFDAGIEFGAGDGYQTTLLAPRCRTFISSDLNFARFKQSLALPTVRYERIDADNLEGHFADGQFDFVFSSSMLEHLSDPAAFLRGTYRLLRGGGYAVHIVPSRTLKVLYLALYYPYLATLLLERLFNSPQKKEGAVSHENNLNPVAPRQKSRMRFLVPQVHGNYASHQEEFARWGKGEWESLFLSAGYTISARLRGPLFSGYGFGFNALRMLLERAGLSSEYIFILQKP